VLTPFRPGAATSQDSVPSSEFFWYQQNILPRLEERKDRIAFRPSRETKTTIFVVISREGRVEASFVENGSGNVDADKAALEVAPLGLQLTPIPSNIYKAYWCETFDKFFSLRRRTWSTS
jgi:hypothetical protein